METLDKHFRFLTKAVFARYGFAHAELLRRWPEIVGEDVSRWCEPERIKWPRSASDAAQKMGGTLVVRAAPGRGLELQHETPLILERVNRYYGYGAVSQIKIHQSGSALRARPSPPIHQPPLPALALPGIADEGLQSALGRLGANVAAAQAISPHGKE